ncbi:hypothetical protein PIB30_040609 [Stylosanthes scabra]|uniref:Uncharacterized protein n=1 Tax=Stylosanthes scabra TaxID=79078 RepID=A0ABU6SGA6_9FABA|nr:hypothetical protein [Stylosanthes scabra]
MPIGNRSEVTVEWAVLIHSIVLGEDIQVDEIIAEQIYKFVNKTRIRTKLPFSGVIQRLCAEKKVSSPEDTMIPKYNCILTKGGTTSNKGLMKLKKKTEKAFGHK